MISIQGGRGKCKGRFLFSRAAAEPAAPGIGIYSGERIDISRIPDIILTKQLIKELAGMSGKENERDSRQRILDAALDVFYEAGFDGARVDEIAKRAGVNQALIYYYFKSKEGLFKELIHLNIDEMILVKKDAVGGKDVYDWSIYDEKLVREVVDRVMGTVREKEKVLSIIAGELFKNSRRQNYAAVFDAFLPAVRDSQKKLLALGADRKEIERGVVAGLFFGSVPMITYVTLGKKMADYYGIDKESMDRIFTEFIYQFSEHYVQFLKDRMKADPKELL